MNEPNKSNLCLLLFFPIWVCEEAVATNINTVFLCLSRQTNWVIQNTNEQSENQKDDCPLTQRQRHLRRFSASGEAASAAAANQQVGHSVAATPELCDCSFLFFSCCYCCLFLFSRAAIYTQVQTRLATTQQ